jgi:hypothetical protein
MKVFLIISSISLKMELWKMAMKRKMDMRPPQRMEWSTKK